jgi:hypothetical protein
VCLCVCVCVCVCVLGGGEGGTRVKTKSDPLQVSGSGEPYYKKETHYKCQKRPTTTSVKRDLPLKSRVTSNTKVCPERRLAI